MQYFVIWPDGQKFGPADLAKLQDWATEGRIKPDTDLESIVDGRRMKAREVTSLTFPAGAESTSTDTPSVSSVTSDSGSAAAVSTPDPSGSTAAATPTAAAASSSSGPTYYVVSDSGQKYGPADAPTLSQWATENRLTPTTTLEDFATGIRKPANQVPGIVFPGGAAGGTQLSSPQTPFPGTGQPIGPSSYGSSNYPRDNYRAPQQKSNAVLVLILGILGLVMCGCLAAIPAWVMGNKTLYAMDMGTMESHDRAMANVGRILGIVGTAFAILGGLFYAIIVVFAASNGGFGP